MNRTIASYDYTAARYAARAKHPLEKELARFRQMVPIAGWVLDVGCGPGQYAQALEARGLHVVGLDLSKAMLHQAQTRVCHEQREAPRLVCADMGCLPIADARADGCFVCASLLHLHQAQASRTLLEFHRVLRPGGALYVCVKEGEGEAWVADQEGHERFFTYYRPEEVDRLIQAASFEIVDGWINPPGKDQHHNWINRFAVARP